MRAPRGNAPTIDALKNAVAGLQANDRDFLEIKFVTACEEFISAASLGQAVTSTPDLTEVIPAASQELPRGATYIRTVPVVSDVQVQIQGPRTIPPKGPGTT
jgi:hypothetical protein